MCFEAVYGYGVGFVARYRRISLTRTALGVMATILLTAVCRRLKILGYSWLVSLSALVRMIILLSRLVSSSSR